MAAYRAAPDGPAGEAVAAQARVSLLATADRAESLGAVGQAIEAITSALEVTRERSDHAQLLERAGYLQNLRSEFAVGQTSLASAVAEYEALGDQAGVIRAVGRRANAYLSAAQIASAVDVAQPIRAVVEALATRSDLVGNDDLRETGEAVAIFSEAVGRTAFRSNEMDEAVRWSDRALALAEPLRLDEIVAMALVTKGTSLMYLGHRRESVALLEGAVLDARAHGQNVAALRGSNNLASATIDTDPRGSLERTRDGMALSRRLGLLSFDGYHAGNAVSSAERLGEWTWVRDAVGELVEAHPGRGDAEWIALCRDFTTAWTGEPDVERAERLHAAALAEHDFQTEVNTDGFLARYAFASGRPDDALRSSEAQIRYVQTGASLEDVAMVARFAFHAGRLDVAQQMLAHASSSSGGGVRDHDIASLRAGIAAVEGRTADAIALHRSALAGYREMGCRFDVALTILDMVTLIGPDEPAVRSSIPEGREILESLGARLLIERLDAVSSETARGTGQARRPAVEPRVEAT